MKECWINVYKYWMAGRWYVFVGKQYFETDYKSLTYMPSVGVVLAYRIHVRMK